MERRKVKEFISLVIHIVGKNHLDAYILQTDNKFIRDDYKVKFNISRDEAIKKLKEAKDLLDIEMMTREEFTN